MNSPIDPFYLYLSLTDELGEGNVFLLDAAAETTSRYRMSLVGALPVLEIQVKDGVTTLFARPGLDEYLQKGLSESGFHHVAAEHSKAESVVSPVSLVYHDEHVMDLLERVRQLMRALYPSSFAPDVPFAAGFLGYIGYDAVHYLEKLPKTTEDDRELPDIRLQAHAAVVHIVGNELRVHDGTKALLGVLSGDDAEFSMAVARLERVLNDVTAEAIGTRGRCVLQELASIIGINSATVETAEDEVSQERFEANVEQAREYIKAGDIFQVVLSKRIRVPKSRHPYLVYDELRRINPSPYMFIGEYPDMRIFGASPEVQFRSVRGHAEMKPIAGTSKGRGATPEEDARLADLLFHNDKERAEHVMLVDLCRNDLGRVSNIASVKVNNLMHVEAYSHLFHLVSEVVGELREDVSVFQALLATFPAGTLSGAPKIRAMEIIDELETLRRGPYGGMIGMIDFDANANTAIVIRTIVEYNDTYYVQVGAGIVADSVPEAEWNECGHKAGAVLQVLGFNRDLVRNAAN